MSPIRVYVSGPYTAEPESCTYDAIDVGNDLLDRGYAPMVPHLTHFWHQHTARHYEDWMHIDLAWVTCTDVVLRIPGGSEGADREVARAQELGIPVVYSRRELYAKFPPDSSEEPAVLPEPIAQALDLITQTFARKNADYADSNWRSNFDEIARQMDFDAVSAADTLIAVKQARLKALSANGRNPQNESVVDTYLDRTVYAVIALALLLDAA